MTPPVQLADMSAAFQLNSLDLGTLSTSTSAVINKWAKWKPVRSSAVSLDTVEERQAAGRLNALTDLTRQFGLYCGVAGTIGDLADIHDCDFIYEQPTTNSGYKFRVLDTVHPTYSVATFPYGYRSDAHCDLNGDVPKNSGDNIVLPNGEVGLLGTINYTPFSAADANEMISITDFFTPETGGGTPVNILDCYPCVLISQGQKQFIRGLYKSNSSQIATIGSTGLYSWFIDMTTLPDGLQTNTSATLSIFLSSGNRLNYPNYKINNWIVFDTNDQPAPSAWASWLCPVPGAVGKEVLFSTPANVTVTLPSPDGLTPGIAMPYFTADDTLKVTFNVTSTVGTTLYMVANLTNAYGDNVEESVILRGNESNQQYDVDFDLSDFTTLFIPGSYEFEIKAYIIKNNNVVVLATQTYTITYS